MTVEQHEDRTAERQRYVAAQQAKIHTQMQLIHLLESQGEDGEVVRMEKQTLDEMIKSLEQVLHQLGVVLPVLAMAGFLEAYLTASFAINATN